MIPYARPNTNRLVTRSTSIGIAVLGLLFRRLWICCFDAAVVAADATGATGRGCCGGMSVGERSEGVLRFLVKSKSAMLSMDGLRESCVGVCASLSV